MVEEFPVVSADPYCGGESPDLSNLALQQSFLERVRHLKTAFPVREGHHLVASFIGHKTGKNHDIPVDLIDAIDDANEPAVSDIHHRNRKGEAAVVAVTAGAIAAAVIVWRKRDK